MMKRLPFVFLFLLSFFCLDLLGQGIVDKHTVICDDRHGADESYETRQMINGYVTGWTEPYVIDLANAQPYHFVYVTDYTDVDEIIVDNSFISQHTLNGSPITTLTLLDDGLGNDELAGDNKFASPDIVYNNPSDYQFPVGLFMRFADVTYMYGNGSSETLNVDLGFGVRALRSDSVNTNISVTSLAPDMQFSSHVVNIAVDLTGQVAFSNLQLRAQKYYEHFPDTKDFLKFATSFATPNGPAASYSRVQVEETGVIYNLAPYDNSASYGSGGELNGIMRYYYTYGGAANLTNHELLHHWGTVLHPDLDLTISGSHWNLVEFQKSGFGSGWQKTNIFDLGSGCYNAANFGYTSEYNELELYLMGLAPISDIPWPLTALADWTYNGFGDPCPFSSTAGLVNITQTQFETLMGPRVPNHTVAQEDFESALIVLTDRLMTPQEMAYYQWQMEQNEMLIGDPNRNSAWSSYNFNEATDGLGTLKTKLPCPFTIGTQYLEITDNPIPSGVYEADTSLLANTPTVMNGNIEFKAGLWIGLEGGFEVQSMTEFLAKIMDCGN